MIALVAKDRSGRILLLRTLSPCGLGEAFIFINYNNNLHFSALKWVENPRI
jgi:hypothetical protein